MTIEKTVTHTEVQYHSLLATGVWTTDQERAKIIDWADARPVVWQLVAPGSKSSVWRASASTYMGCERGDSPSALLERAICLHDETEKSGIWGFRARFSIDHYKDKGFKTGFFRQWDGTQGQGEATQGGKFMGYSRGCLYLDYTDKTLDAVLHAFQAWCENGWAKFPTRAITIDGNVVKEYQ